MDTVLFFGLPLRTGNFDEATRFVREMYCHAGNNPKLLCHINANNFERLLGADLLDSLATETVMLLDGIGLKLAAAIQGNGWVHDLNGTDLFPMVINNMDVGSTPLFLLGGRQDIVEGAAKNITRKWGVPIAGCHHGFFEESEERDICDRINASGAKILLIGLGCPRQEAFMLRNRSALKTQLIWVVGGLFDFMAGANPRAPLLLRKTRLEWLFRWAIEPRQKTYRTFFLYPKFIFRTLLGTTLSRPIVRGELTVTENNRMPIPTPPLKAEGSPSAEGAERVAEDQANESDQTDVVNEFSPPPVSTSNRLITLFKVTPDSEPVTTVAPSKKAPTKSFSLATSLRVAATEMLAKRFQAPPYLIIFVSDKCWMRCAHCWFSEDWKGEHHTRPIMTFDDYSKLADSARLKFVSFTGGEAFRRDDIVELITMMRQKSGITRYQIPTSGYLPDMIVGKAEKLLINNPQIPFRVDVSLDGTQAIHDKIRAVKGGWSKAFETIKQLNVLKKKYAHFDVGVITTISHNNQDHVDETSRIIRTVHSGEWMINIARGTPRDPNATQVDLKNYRRAAVLADQSLISGASSGHRGSILGPLLTVKNTVRRRIIIDTLEGRRSGGGCAAGSLGGVIYADGEVHACELLDDKIGNLHDFEYNLPAIWQSSEAQMLRRHIQESRCQCTQECFLSVSMLIQPTAVAAMGAELIKRVASGVLPRDINKASH